MKIWQGLMRLIGAASLVLCAWGSYLLIDIIGRERHHPLFLPQAPLVRQAFFVLNAMDAVFLLAIAFASIWLLLIKPHATRIYTWSIAVLVAYEIAVGALWVLPNPAGVSIAAASGVGSMGTSPLILFPVPFAYPLISVAVVNVARHRLKRLDCDVPSAAPA